MALLGPETKEPPDEKKVLTTIRSEAAALVRKLPGWMDFDDLVSVGWLGYMKGWERAGAHQLAKKYAMYEMLSAIQLWYGNGRTELGIKQIPLGNEHLDLTDEDFMSITERRDLEDFGEKLMSDMFAHLTIPQRQVLFFRFEHNLKFREIGELLGLKTSTASLQYTVAMKFLRKLLCAA